MKLVNNEWIKLFLTIVIGNSILTTLGSCDPECNYDIETRDDHVTFALVDKRTGEYLFKESNLNYHVDTFKIFNENNVPLGEYDYNYFRDGSLGYRFNIISIYNQRTDPDPVTQEVCKKYFLYLNYNDTDTLQTCFTARRDGCLYFNRFQAYYNDSLVFTKQGSQLVQFSIVIPK